MRLTIIPIDKLIAIDEKGLKNINDDFSWIPPNVHAVQWHDNWGEVEYNNGDPNTKIFELGIYRRAIDVLNEALKLEEIRLQEEKIKMGLEGVEL
jgi:hypothetical protein